MKNTDDSMKFLYLKRPFLERLPAVALVRICNELSETEFAMVSMCDKFMRNACHHIKPVLHNPMFFDFHVLQGRISGTFFLQSCPS
jgi:hypothetical protein